MLLPRREDIERFRLPARFELATALVRIGRTDENEIHLAAVASISRRHALLERVRNRWLVRNLSETNPIRVNGRVVSDLELRRGDILQVGEVVFSFVDEDRAASTLLMIEKDLQTPFPPPTTRSSPTRMLRELVSGILSFLECASPLRTEAEVQSSLLDTLKLLLAGDVMLFASIVNGRVSQLIGTGQALYSASLLERCLERGTSMLWHAESVAPTESSASEFDITSALCVPIGSAPHMSGIVYLHRCGAKQYTLRDLDAARAIARVAQVVLANLRLRETATELEAPS